MALGFTAAALLLRFALAGFAGRLLLVLFVLPVIASAALGGLEAGILATFASALLVGKFLEPSSPLPLMPASLEWTQRVVFCADGIVISWVIHILQRNSQRMRRDKEAIEESASRLQKAARTELRLQKIIEEASEMLTMRDAEGRLLFANPAVERITGYGPLELSSLQFGDNIVEKDRLALRKAFAELKPGHSVRNLRLQARSKDGTLRWLEGTISNFLDDPDVGAVVTNFRDVSAQVLLSEQLNHAQKMEAVGRLAGGIAHDFNNILLVINGYSDEALRALPEGDPARAWMEPIRQSAQRATLLTRQLLAFSRKQVLQPRWVQPNEVLGRLESMIARILGEDIKIVLGLAPDLEGVWIDPGHFEQIIINLLVNARDAMPQGGKITVETANVDLDGDHIRRHGEGKPGPHVMVSIADTGTGMDAATQARIFEPFFTTKPVGVGTGLGLSTVYGIVRQSGGNIWVYSEVGVGTVFKIYLPREKGTATVEAPAAPVPAPAGGKETLLLVEDDDSVRKFLAFVLEGGGYQVLATGDPEQALEHCRSHAGRIHLLLTDMVMPRMSGQAMAERVVALRPDIKVAYMSGYSSGAIAHDGDLGGGTLFLEKPIGRVELLSKIRAFLG